MTPELAKTGRARIPAVRERIENGDPMIVPEPVPIAQGIPCSLVTI
jgi:hypothetical protein